MFTMAAFGGGQAALAVEDTYRSWSYYTDRDGNYTKDDHFWTAESQWQGSSSVEYNADNFAKSLVGFGAGGSLEAKAGVSVNNSLRRVYTQSYYRDDGFQCGADSCGTAVPLGGGFQMRLHQDGSITAGSSNFSLNYYLRTPGTAYSFYFSLEQGEMALKPRGWFAAENLVSGSSTLVDMVSNPSLFNLIWEQAENDSGVYNFSYDFTFAGATNGVDLGEELSVYASAFPYGGTQFFDSYNSFHSDIIPDDGVSFYRGGQLLVGNTGPQTPAVPEPSSMLLLASGLLAILFQRKFAA